VADDFDLVAGERPFLSFAVVCFCRAADVVVFDLAGERLLLLLLLFWRAFVCRPVDFDGVTVSLLDTVGAVADEFDDDDRAFIDDVDDLRVVLSSTSINCVSISVFDVIGLRDNCSIDERVDVFGVNDRTGVISDTSVFIIVDACCIPSGGFFPFVVFETSLSVVSSREQEDLKIKRRLCFYN
jgi:hypothetical protein